MVYKYRIYYTVSDDSRAQNNNWLLSDNNHTLLVG